MIQLRKSIQTFVNNRERDSQALNEARGEIAVLRARLVVLQRGRGGREAILVNDRKLHQANDLMEKKLEQARCAHMTVLAENGRLRDSINSLRKESGQISVVAKALLEDAESMARDSIETEAKVAELKERVVETEAYRDGLHEEFKLESSSILKELKRLGAMEAKEVERRVRLEQMAASVFGSIAPNIEGSGEGTTGSSQQHGQTLSSSSSSQLLGTARMSSPPPSSRRAVAKSTRVGVGEAMLAAATQEASKSTAHAFNPEDRPFSRQFQALIRSGRAPSTAELRHHVASAMAAGGPVPVHPASKAGVAKKGPAARSGVKDQGSGALRRGESLPELPRPRGDAAMLQMLHDGGKSATSLHSDGEGGSADVAMTKALVRNRWQIGMLGARAIVRGAQVSRACALRC
jgi:hypothetical protein